MNSPSSNASPVPITPAWVDGCANDFFRLADYAEAATVENAVLSRKLAQSENEADELRRKLADAQATIWRYEVEHSRQRTAGQSANADEQARSTERQSTPDARPAKKKRKAQRSSTADSQPDSLRVPEVVLPRLENVKRKTSSKSSRKQVSAEERRDRELRRLQFSGAGPKIAAASADFTEDAREDANADDEVPDSSMHEPVEHRFLCNLCGKTFPSELSLRNHDVRAHPQRGRHACKRCGQKFDTREALRRHGRRGHRRAASVGVLEQQEAEANEFARSPVATEWPQPAYSLPPPASPMATPMFVVPKIEEGEPRSIPILVRLKSVDADAASAESVGASGEQLLQRQLNYPAVQAAQRKSDLSARDYVQRFVLGGSPSCAASAAAINSAPSTSGATIMPARVTPTSVKPVRLSLFGVAEKRQVKDASSTGKSDPPPPRADHTYWPTASAAEQNAHARFHFQCSTCSRVFPTFEMRRVHSMSCAAYQRQAAAETSRGATFGARPQSYWKI